MLRAGRDHQTRATPGPRAPCGRPRVTTSSSSNRVTRRSGLLVEDDEPGPHETTYRPQIAFTFASNACGAAGVLRRAECVRPPSRRGAPRSRAEGPRRATPASRRRENVPSAHPAAGRRSAQARTGARRRVTPARSWPRLDHTRGARSVPSHRDRPATRLTGTPASHASTIRARTTSRCAIALPRARRFSSAFCSLVERNVFGTGASIRERRSGSAWKATFGRSYEARRRRHDRQVHRHLGRRLRQRRARHRALRQHRPVDRPRHQFDDERPPVRRSFARSRMTT